MNEPTVSVAVARPTAAASRVAFGALLLRDLAVLRKNLSEFILRTLQQEMMIDCKILNPTSFLQLELPSQQTVEIEQVAPQLTVALGAALAVL